MYLNVYLFVYLSWVTICVLNEFKIFKSTLQNKHTHPDSSDQLCRCHKKVVPLWLLQVGVAVSSAVTDCQKYRLSEYSRNDTTCQSLMAALIHKQHGKNKIIASLYWQDVTLLLNGINTLANWWEVCF